MRTILSRALAELNAHRSVVLVTIVAEQGSAPRGPGSQMLVGADGQLTGTIGGGQVERQSELLALSLLNTDDNLTNFGLVAAGGVVSVIPITLFVIFAQNYLISGLSSGAVKD